MKTYCQNHNNFFESLLPNSSTPECLSTHGIDEFTFVHLLAGTGSKIYFPNTKINILLIGHLIWEFFETTDFFKINVSKFALLNGSTIEYKGDSIMNTISDDIAFYLGHKLQKNFKLSKRDFNKLFIIANLAASLISLFRFG